MAHSANDNLTAFLAILNDGPVTACRTRGGKRRVHQVGSGKFWNKFKQMCGFQTTHITPSPGLPSYTRIMYGNWAGPTQQFVLNPIATPYDQQQIQLAQYSQYSQYSQHLIVRNNQLMPIVNPPVINETAYIRAKQLRPPPPLPKQAKEISTKLTHLPTEMLRIILENVASIDKTDIASVQAIAASCKTLNDAISGDILLFTRDFFISTLSNIIDSIRVDGTYDFNIMFRKNVDDPLQYIQVEFSRMSNDNELKALMKDKNTSDDESDDSDAYSGDTWHDSFENIVRMTYESTTCTIREFGEPTMDFKEYIENRELRNNPEFVDYQTKVAIKISEWIGNPTRLLVFDTDLTDTAFEDVDMISITVLKSEYVAKKKEYQQILVDLNQLYANRSVLSSYFDMRDNGPLRYKDKIKILKGNLPHAIYNKFIASYNIYLALEYIDAKSKSLNLQHARDKSLDSLKDILHYNIIYGLTETDLQEKVESFIEQTKAQAIAIPGGFNNFLLNQTKYMKTICNVNHECDIPRIQKIDRNIEITVKNKNDKWKELYNMQEEIREQRISILDKDDDEDSLPRGGKVLFKKTNEKYNVNKSTTRIIYIGPCNKQHVKLHGEFVTIKSIKSK
jgi:hypothetical protein